MADLQKIVAEMERLSKNDEKFVPAEILKSHAKNSTKFYTT